jgi:hypothetical protein
LHAALITLKAGSLSWECVIYSEQIGSPIPRVKCTTNNI